MANEILLLDDDRATLSFLETVLTGAGFKCCTATEPSQALAMVSTHKEIAVVVSDIYMPDLTGLQFTDLLNSLKLNWSAPAVLLMTVRPTLECVVDAIRLGACDFLTKPIRPTELVVAVCCAMTRAVRERSADKKEAADLEQLTRQADKSLAALSHIRRAGSQGLPSVIEVIERLRTLRHRYVDHKLDDVAWDLLLECWRAEQNQRRLPVSALLISIPNASSTTCFRRINELSDRGYLERMPDAEDGRREFVRLTAMACDLLADFLAHADTCLTARPPNGQVPSSSRCQS